MKVLQFAAMNQTLRVFLWIAALPLLVLVLTAAADEVEITAEPSHHLVFENSEVRVFSVSVAPHASTLMHRHRHDYVFVTVGDTSISNEVEGRDPVELKLNDGAARFATGNFAHIARNLGDVPFRNVTIELLQDEKRRTTPSPWKKDSGEEEFAAGRRKILFVKDAVRVSEIDLSPGGIVRNEGTGPQLLVAVSKIELHSDMGSKGSVEILKAGESKWVDESSRILNSGHDPARLVVLEF
ncbi:MAG TPA: hypothetical protein VMI10_19095 [Terriglobales bacterium]|nr:hypothetical protein [Terriglobales bacterium]